MTIITIAQYGLLLIFSLFLVFHFLVLLKVIPYSIVWGGRLKSDREMYRFEIISILVNSIFLILILIQSGILTYEFPQRIMTIMLCFMSGLFLLNTLGNFMSKNRMEKILFTPVTIILTVLTFLLALYN
jgi:hypothetical protein